MTLQGLRRSGVVQCLQPYWRGLWLLLALQLLQTLATLLLPHLGAEVVDLGVAKGDSAYVQHMGGVMLAVALTQALLAVAATWLGARLAMGYGRDLRARVFAQVQSYSLQELNNFGYQQDRIV